MRNNRLPTAPIVGDVVDEIVNICAGASAYCWLSLCGLLTVRSQTRPPERAVYLFREVIAEIKPKMVLFENVHSILSAAHRDDFCFIDDNGRPRIQHAVNALHRRRSTSL
jgi:hypothetical protein